MTIAKGTDWGYPAELPLESPVHNDDASLFRSINELRSSQTAIGVVGLTGGTLWEMLGGPTCVGRLLTTDARAYACDLGRVETDEGTFWFGCSLVARTLTWSSVVLAMNAQNIGPYRFGHRAHPNDGLLDVYEADLPLQQRLAVAKRAKLGAHLPHPGIRERRVGSVSISMPHRRKFWLDGVASGRSRNFTLTVEPDALTVVV